jgi:hypothetical protein
MTIKKERAIFWLKRRIRDLEAKSASPDHEALARQRASYADRQQYEAAAAKVREETAVEIEAMEHALACVEASGG